MSYGPHRVQLRFLLWYRGRVQAAPPAFSCFSWSPPLGLGNPLTLHHTKKHHCRGDMATAMTISKTAQTTLIKLPAPVIVPPAEFNCRHCGTKVMGEHGLSMGSMRHAHSDLEQIGCWSHSIHPQHFAVMLRMGGVCEPIVRHKSTEKKRCIVYFSLYIYM